MGTKASPCPCRTPFSLSQTAPPHNGRQVQSEKQRLRPGLGAFIFRKLYKVPWCGGWGCGGDSPAGEKTTLCARPVWPRRGQVQGGRTWGGAPSIGGEGVSAATLLGPSCLVRFCNQPSLGTSSAAESGDTPPPPRLPLGQVPRARAAPGGRRRRHRATVSRRHLAPDLQARTTWGPADGVPRVGGKWRGRCGVVVR